MLADSSVLVIGPGRYDGLPLIICGECGKWRVVQLQIEATMEWRPSPLLLSRAQGGSGRLRFCLVFWILTWAWFGFFFSAMGKDVPFSNGGWIYQLAIGLQERSRSHWHHNFEFEGCNNILGIGKKDRLLVGLVRKVASSCIFFVLLINLFVLITKN